MHVSVHLPATDGLRFKLYYTDLSETSSLSETSKKNSYSERQITLAGGVALAAIPFIPV